MVYLMQLLYEQLMECEQDDGQRQQKIVEMAKRTSIIQERSLCTMFTIFKRVVEIPDPIDIQSCWFEVNQQFLECLADDN